MVALRVVRPKTDSAVLPPRLARKATLPVGAELFQRDLAHGLVAHDFADFQTLNSQLALLVFSADHFGADRVRLLAETIRNLPAEAANLRSVSRILSAASSTDPDSER